MGKNAQVRLTETFKYLDKITAIPSSPYAKFKSAKKNDLAASKRVSLGGGSRGTSTTAEKLETQRRHALRGLLLCMDWAGGQSKIAQAKIDYDKVNESTIKKAIQSFFPITGKNAQDAVIEAKANKITIYGRNIDITNFYKFYREAVKGNKIKMSGACYESVCGWMYLAGITSLKWILDNGNQPRHALPVPWNWGPSITSLETAAQIPAGRIVRFLRDEAGLHYVISTGNGKCIGNHNTGEICEFWLDGYGPAPTRDGHTTEFSIAGYLANMQARNRNTKIPSLRSAPIVPKAPY